MRERLRASDDAGFSMVEVLVAAVVLALAATVLAGLFTQTLKLAQSNTQRTTAANLATAQVEKLQAVRALDIPDGLTTLGPYVVGGTSYTIKQTAEYQTTSGTACSGTGTAISSKKVTLLVTWPNMGNVQPVRTDTIRTLGTGSDDLGSSTGAAAVAVQNASGGGTSGIQITLKTAPGGTVIATQTAGNDGCVVFANLAIGNYTVAANTTGYVNVDGTQAASSSTFGVTANTVTKAVLPYDLLGGMAVTPKPSNSNFAVPASMGITFTTSIWSPSQNRVYSTCVGSVVSGCVSGTAVRTAASLFPASYGAWAGTCADAAPTTKTLQPVTAGNTTAYNATNLGLVTANITTLATGKHLYAVHAADASCTAGEVYDFGVVTTGQTLKIAVPYGLWNFQTSSTGATVTQQAALSSTNPSVTVAVLL